jgi:hypothetical protein
MSCLFGKNNEGSESSIYLKVKSFLDADRENESSDTETKDFITHGPTSSISTSVSFLFAQVSWG